jgi:ubiquinone/menaquinone biosynthesis C-methylase UbiE
MNKQERSSMIKETFNTVADGYDNHALRYFADSANQLATYLNLRGDERLLDVATGTGSNALVLARHLPFGHVTGIDFSEGMLKQARVKAEFASIRNVDFVEMDMQQLSFSDNEFDVATCAFGIFFVEDMEGQLGLIVSKVKTGGKVAVTSFYDNAFLPLVEMFFKRLVLYGVERPPLSWKRIATEEKLTALFESAKNLNGIVMQRKNIGYYLRSADEWWDLIWYAGLRALVNQLSQEQLGKFKAEHLAEIQSMASDEGIWLDVEVLYAIGFKAA